MKIDTECAPAWNNLGVVSFLEGNYSEAFEYFKNALVFDAENPDTWYNYRDTCYELGMNEEAEFADSMYHQFLRH